MKKRGINKFLQIKIKKYLEYMFEERKMNFKDTIFLTNSLSQSLKEEYYLELYGKILKTNRFFSLFSESFLNKLTHKFYETTYGPDDLIDVFIFFDTVNFCDFHFSYIYIYQNKEDNELLIYFILKGESKVVLHNKNNNKSEYAHTLTTVKVVNFLTQTVNQH